MSTTEENIKFTIDHLKQMEPHPERDVYIKQTLDRFFGMRAAISALALHMKPRVYLNVGVGKGYCMSLVAHRCPTVSIHGFDAWIGEWAPVAGDATKSIEYVTNEIAKHPFCGKLQFHTGKTNSTLSKFFAYRDTRRYHLIDVDAEHTVQAKLKDWTICAKYLAPGGYMLVYGMEIAYAVWEILQHTYPNYEYKVIDRLGIVHNPERK